MANLGYHYIYRRLRELGASVERFFASPVPYRSVEGDVMLERFPIVMAAVAYEGDVPVLAKWLARGGISPSRERRDRDGFPLVGAGGAITYINPLSLAGVCDFIVLGDGLPVLPHIVDTLRSAGGRSETLKKLAEHPSILIPALHLDGHARLEVSKRADLSDDFGHGNWIAPMSAFGDTLLVELQRGCERGCGFCVLPSCFAPLRRRRSDVVSGDVKNVSERVEFAQVGLVTPEAGDYPRLDRLLEDVEFLGKGVSFASLRVDGLTRNVVKALARGGRHSLTIAPETGDDEFRASCGKRFTNDRIIDALAMAKEEGIAKVKLYFMIGLPGESDGEILSIAALCGRIRRETGLRLTATVSPFIPKPGAAWQCESFTGERELKAKLALLRSSAGGIPGVSIQNASVKEASLEYALSWASLDTSKKIAEAAEYSVSIKIKSAFVDRDAATRELSSLGLFTK
ncbi:MAG: B12-binding domain-containing radical SAM protein [Synergistaceae bacterium]|jgi:radical SAM superfamily enzyme YgiQ (UPF0313 family)|nr:B12-binding domain-containing radical SAM protein [Synergistaceae bacterium]